MFQTLSRLIGCTLPLPARRDRAGRRAKVSLGITSSRRARLCLELLEDRVTPSLSAVGNATVFPSRAVVELQTYWQNGTTSVGTGVMVDSFHVLTAGHNIYSYANGGYPQNPNGGFAKNITVTPALSGNSAPFGTANMDWEYVTGSYMTYSANNPGKTGPGSQDIGLITLNKAIGNSTGWLGMWYYSNDVGQLQSLFNGFSVSTAGYPGSNLHPTLLQNGQTAVGTTMYQESGTTSGISSDGSEIEWSLSSIETHGGQSGSPVAIRDPKGNISVVGILVGEDTVDNYGVATRISKSCFDWLTSCMQYDAAHRPPQPAPAPSTTSISSTSTPNDLGLVSTSGGTANNSFTGPGNQPSLAATTTTLNTTASTVQAGQPVTLTAIVTGSGSTIPTGTVTFYDGGTMLGELALSANAFGFAYANWNTAALAVGSHSLTAVYNGDSNNRSSSTTAVTETVAPPATPPGFSYDLITQVLTITAGTAQNTFTFSQNTTQDQSGLHTTSTFVLNGASFSLSDAVLSQVIVNAATGANSAVLITSDTYTGADGKTHETAESVQSGPGGGTVSRTDANGNVAVFLTLSGFQTSYAYVGRADSAQLKGAPGSSIENIFVTAGTYGYISGGGEFHLVSGAPQVYGYAVNGIDQVWHYDAAGGLDAFVASGNAFSYLSGADSAGNSFFNEGVGYQVSYGISTHGNAIAYLIDSPGNDTFVGGTTMSYLSGTDSAGGVFNVAEAFAQTYAESFVGGSDYAYNHDSSHNILSNRWVLLT